MEVNATLLVQVAMIVSLLLLMSRLLWKPYLALLDERERQISGAQTETNSLLERIEKKSLEIDEKIDVARKESAAMLTQMQTTAKESYAKIVADHKTACTKETDSTRIAIESALEAARQDLTDESKSLSKKVVEVLLKKNEKITMDLEIGGQNEEEVNA